jgi:hypothetical protein
MNQPFTQSHAISVAINVVVVVVVVVVVDSYAKLRR